MKLQQRCEVRSKHRHCFMKFCFIFMCTIIFIVVFLIGIFNTTIYITKSPTTSEIYGLLIQRVWYCVGGKLTPALTTRQWEGQYINMLGFKYIIIKSKLIYFLTSMPRKMCINWPLLQVVKGFYCNNAHTYFIKYSCFVFYWNSYWICCDALISYWEV